MAVLFSLRQVCRKPQQRTLGEWEGGWGFEVLTAILMKILDFLEYGASLFGMELAILYYPEDGRITFLRNATCIPGHMASYPKRLKSWSN